jgi:hypothetical protein
MSDSTFIQKLRASGLSKTDQEALIAALQADLSAEPIRPNPPLLRQQIAASSGDHRHTPLQKLMASASARFGVGPVDGQIQMWDLRASEKFKRLDPSARMVEIHKLKHAGALRTTLED